MTILRDWQRKIEVIIYSFFHEIRKFHNPQSYIVPGITSNITGSHPTDSINK